MMAVRHFRQLCMAVRDVQRASLSPNTSLNHHNKP